MSEQREKELTQIIQEEKLKEPETRKYLANAFRDGEIKTVGTDIDKLMPPVSRFGGGGRTQKKQTVIDKLKGFFDKFFGIGGNSMSEENSWYYFDTKKFSNVVCAMNLIEKSTLTSRIDKQTCLVKIKTYRIWITYNQPSA